MVGELETRVVESSPTFNETLMPLTEVTEGDVVKWVQLKCRLTLTVTFAPCKYNEMASTEMRWGEYEYQCEMEVIYSA